MVSFTGWNSGFQITLIGMNVLAFYAEYTGRNCEDIDNVLKDADDKLYQGKQSGKNKLVN